MPIDSLCTGCGSLLRVANELAGAKARCPACGNVYQVPSDSQLKGPIDVSDASFLAESLFVVHPDRKIYGPAKVDVIEQWIRDGRVNDSCRIRNSHGVEIEFKQFETLRQFVNTRKELGSTVAAVQTIQPIDDVSSSKAALADTTHAVAIESVAPNPNPIQGSVFTNQAIEAPNPFAEDSTRRSAVEQDYSDLQNRQDVGIPVFVISLISFFMFCVPIVPFVLAVIALAIGLPSLLNEKSSATKSPNFVLNIIGIVISILVLLMSGWTSILWFV